MDPSSATLVDTDTEQSLQNFLADVEQEADRRGLEVLFLLLDKLEQLSTVSVVDALRFYVALKLSRHHFRKHYNHGWSWPEISFEEFSKRDEKFTLKIKEARRNYYVAKQRFEQQRDGRSS